LEGNSLEKLILFGNGQVASNSYSRFTHDTDYEVAAFTVDSSYIKEKTLFGLPVVPFENIEKIFPPGEYKMNVSISFRGVNKLRANKYFQAKNKGYSFVNCISKSSQIWPDTKIGQNCQIGSNCVISPFAEIGDNVSIGSGSIIEHHTVIKDHCFLSDSVTIGGSVIIEPYCFLGAGSIVRDRVMVLKACVIGAGAVILQNTEEKGVYMAHPAERLPITSDDLKLG